MATVVVVFLALCFPASGPQLLRACVRGRVDSVLQW